MSLSFKNTELPTVVEDNTVRRRALSFSVEGLTAREELLFKGFIRLLDHLTEHEWHPHEPSVLHRVDLLVASEHVMPTQFLPAGAAPQPLLQLGKHNLHNSSLFLSWPLKPKELENQLNSLGRLICGDVAPPQGWPDAEAGKLANTTPAALFVEPAPAKEAARCYRLSKWPKPMLLSEPGRMRLATLITGRAMSLEELVFRTALPTLVCERFVADMQTAGLILPPDSEASQAPVWVAPPPRKPRPHPLLERQAGPVAAKQEVQAGLFARIRSRLGIKNLTPS